MAEDPDDKVGARMEMMAEEILTILGRPWRCGTAEKPAAEMRDDRYSGRREVSDMHDYEDTGGVDGDIRDPETIETEETWGNEIAEGVGKWQQKQQRCKTMMALA